MVQTDKLEDPRYKSKQTATCILLAEHHKLWKSLSLLTILYMNHLSVRTNPEFVNGASEAIRTSFIMQ